MTRLVHIGDLHLQPGPRNPGRLKALDQIISENRDYPRLGAWLFPGDLGEARLTIADTNALDERLTAMAMMAPVVVCYGNHCRSGDLDGFQRLKTTFPIFVISEAQTIHLTLATGEEASIFVLPYPLRGQLAGMGIAHHDQLDAADEALNYIFLRAGHELDEARAHGRLTAMAGHANIAGARLSSGQPSVGREIDITADHLMRLGHCYKGLNHVHEFQQIQGAWYPGSVTPTTHGESSPRFYLIAEYEPQADGSWDYQVLPQRIDTKPLFYVDGKLTREGFTYRVTDGPGGEEQPRPATWHDCEIKVKYSFLKSETGTLAKAAMEAEFAAAGDFVLYEPVAISDRAVRAPEVAAAITFEDKARAWATVNGLSLSDTLIEKLHAIANGDKEQFLATLAVKLAESDRQEVMAAA